MTPPTPERRPYSHTEHGVARDDPWHWLRERADPAVLEHLQAENEWTAEQLAPLAPLREQIHQELRARLQEADRSAPCPHGPWEYYTRTVKGRAYPVRCRQPRGGGDEQVLLDQNLLAEGHSYSSVADTEPSPDHRTLAYFTDFTGEERHTLRFRDLSTGIDLPDELSNTSGSVAWTPDSRTVWFCELDAAHRAHRMLKYTLGSGLAPTVVYEEPDEGFRVAVDCTRSGRFFRLTIRNASTSEVRLAPTDALDAPLQVVLPRRKGVKYTVEDAGSSLFLVTNTGADEVPGSAVNHRLLERRLPDGPWAERIAHRPDVELVDLDGFADHLLLSERDRGQLGLRVLDLRTGADRRVGLPETPSSVFSGYTPEYAEGRARVRFTSLTTPLTDFDLDLDTLELHRLKEQAVPGYDRTRYRTERLEATSSDGTSVPISIVYRADVDRTAGPHPTVLTGYGAYGIAQDPVFASSRVSLLDRGVVYAVAHVRGGGDLGRAWYEAGKLEHKHRSFEDFVACARHLVGIGVTAPDRLCAHGGSAGGLLVGAAMNQAPELFRAVFAAVPFVDCLSTMLDATLPLTIPEYDEWGDPNDRAVFDRILAWSPYDNVRVGVRYPDVLATGGWNDPRVPYWEPAKWVLRLRERSAGGEFLLRTQLGAGHQGRSGRYGPLEERALEWAWILGRIAPA